MTIDDRGSITALVVGLVMTFVACAGLAVDGGRLVTAKVRASDRAENAARLGAQAVTGLRLGVPEVDERRAVRIAGEFLESFGASGNVEANRYEVCVTIREQVEMTLLGLVGVSSKSVGGHRCARPIME
jgi:Putative Flp pilus-assembly TadE/G-like